MPSPQEEVGVGGKFISGELGKDNRLFEEGVELQSKPLPFPSERPWTVAVL